MLFVEIFICVLALIVFGLSVVKALADMENAKEEAERKRRLK